MNKELTYEHMFSSVNERPNAKGAISWTSGNLKGCSTCHLATEAIYQVFGVPRSSIVGQELHIDLSLGLLIQLGSHLDGI